MPRWQLDASSGLTLHVPARLVPVVALAVLAALAAFNAQATRADRLAAEVARLDGASAGTARREKALEATIARQHQALQRAEGELDTLRYQIDAVELQLDGVDYLSGVLRDELGLPPGAGTWTVAPGAPPQGGPNATSPDHDRVALIQRRLAAGLAELYRLHDFAQARHDAATAGPARAGRAARDLDPHPANWPARGPVTSDFGWRVFRGRPNFHTGIDIGLDYGSQVMATAPGTVVGSGWQPGYGWSVLVQHDDGYNTLYAHLSRTLVGVGDVVVPGDVVALSGSSGMSTGPHLHYEVWKDGQTLDPRPSMDGTGAR